MKDEYDKPLPPSGSGANNRVSDIDDSSRGGSNSANKNNSMASFSSLILFR